MAAILPAERKRAKLKVLVPDDYGDRVRHLECARRFPEMEFNIVPGPVREKSELVRLLADADAMVLIRERTHVGPDLLDAAPRLKIISQLGLVRRNLSIAECSKRGIAVAEGPTVSQGTAELAWAMIMSARRFVPQETTALRQRMT